MEGIQGRMTNDHHMNGFEHLDLPGTPGHFAEKAGGLNSDGTALLHYISCGVTEGLRIVVDGRCVYALDRDHWRQDMSTPTSDDAALLRDLALTEAMHDLEAKLTGLEVPWFKPYRGPDSATDRSPKYVTP
jgi:hypothetical protein